MTLTDFTVSFTYFFIVGDCTTHERIQHTHTPTYTGVDRLQGIFALTLLRNTLSSDG